MVTDLKQYIDFILKSTVPSATTISSAAFVHLTSKQNIYRPIYYTSDHNYGISSQHMCILRIGLVCVQTAFDIDAKSYIVNTPIHNYYFISRSTPIGTYTKQISINASGSVLLAASVYLHITQIVYTGWWTPAERLDLSWTPEIQLEISNCFTLYIRDLSIKSPRLCSGFHNGVKFIRMPFGTNHSIQIKGMVCTLTPKVWLFFGHNLKMSSYDWSKVGLPSVAPDIPQACNHRWISQL